MREFSDSNGRHVWEWAITLDKATPSWEFCINCGMTRKEASDHIQCKGPVKVERVTEDKP